MTPKKVQRCEIVLCRLKIIKSWTILPISVLILSRNGWAMSKFLSAVPLALLWVLGGCTGATPGPSTVVLKPEEAPSPPESNKESGNANPQQPAGGTSAGSGASSGGSSGGNVTTEKFSFAEASQLCTGCHVANGTYKDVPLTTIEEWNDRSKVCRYKLESKVSSGSMPPQKLGDADKTKLLNFIKSLADDTPACLDKQKKEQGG